MYFFERQSYRKRRGMREIFHDCNWARPDPESWDWVLEESSTAFPATLLGSWVDAEQLGLTLVVILIAGKVNSGFTFWATALAPEIIKFCSLYTGKDEFQKDWKVFRLSSKVEIGRLDLLASWNLSFRLKMIVAPVAQLVSAGTYKTQDDKCTPLCWASQQTAISNWPHCSFFVRLVSWPLSCVWTWTQNLSWRVCRPAGTGMRAVLCVTVLLTKCGGNLRYV